MTNLTEGKLIIHKIYITDCNKIRSASKGKLSIKFRYGENEQISDLVTFFKEEIYFNKGFEIQLSEQPYIIVELWEKNLFSAHIVCETIIDLNLLYSCANIDQKLEMFRKGLTHCYLHVSLSFIPESNNRNPGIPDYNVQAMNPNSKVDVLLKTTAKPKNEKDLTLNDTVQTSYDSSCKTSQFRENQNLELLNYAKEIEIDLTQLSDDEKSDNNMFIQTNVTSKPTISKKTYKKDVGEEFYTKIREILKPGLKKEDKEIENKNTEKYSSPTTILANPKSSNACKEVLQTINVYPQQFDSKNMTEFDNIKNAKLKSKSQNDQTGFEKFTDQFFDEKTSLKKTCEANQHKYTILAETEIYLDSSNRYPEHIMEPGSSELKADDKKTEIIPTTNIFSSEIFKLIAEIDNSSQNVQKNDRIDVMKSDNNTTKILKHSEEEFEKIATNNIKLKEEDYETVPIFSSQLYGENGDFQNRNKKIEQTHSDKLLEISETETNYIFDSNN